jgi:hypothetical protein
MESLIRNVGDIDAHDRQALEHVLGLSLRENQQLVIHIVNLKVEAEADKTPASQPGSEIPALPDWCKVYEGMSDADIDDVEQTILQRAELGRPTV